MKSFGVYLQCEYFKDIGAVLLKFIFVCVIFRFSYIIVIEHIAGALFPGLFYFSNAFTSTATTFRNQREAAAVCSRFKHTIHAA